MFKFSPNPSNTLLSLSFIFSFDSVLKDRQAENYDFKGLNFVVICMYRITKVCFKKKVLLVYSVHIQYPHIHVLH